MAKKLLRYLSYANFEPEQFRRVSRDIDSSNFELLKIISLISVCSFVLLFGLSFVINGLDVNRWIYFGSCVAMLLIQLFLRLFPKCAQRTTRVLVYLVIAVFYLFATLLAAYANPNEPATSFCVFALTLPLLFLDRPFRLCLSTVIASAVYTVFAVQSKTPYVLVRDLFNVWSFTLLSCLLCCYMTSVKIGRFVLADRTIMLSETDLLTGCKNRNCYEERLEAYPKQCRHTLACVYIDANGLHELNNAKGHTAGDAMLRLVAQRLQRSFGIEHTYRIGGDEFIAMAVDLTPEQLKRHLADIRGAVEDAGYTISVGSALASRRELKLGELVQTAETRMYEDKAAYYARMGTVSRRSSIHGQCVQ